MTDKNEGEKKVPKNSQSLPVEQSENAQEESGEVSKFFDRIGEAVTAGVETLKDSAEKLTHKAGEVGKIAKLKLEIHNLESDCNSLYLKMGMKIWESRDRPSRGLLDKVRPELDQVAALSKEIEMKAAEVVALSEE